MGVKPSNNMRVLVLLAVICAYAQASSSPASSTCLDFKEAYQGFDCCGNEDVREVGSQIVPKPAHQINYGSNPCDGKKPTADYWTNEACTTEDSQLDGSRNPAVLEQAGANVTAGYAGLIDSSSREPILTTYLQAGLCPVNVHFHLGAEHYSKGQFDETGTGPHGTSPGVRRSGEERQGFQCKLYDASDAKFTTEYDFKFCSDMHVGETYEIHWPHSAAGACGIPYQYQTPFYDGVFCTDGILSLGPSPPLNTYQKIGVQSQVFTIVNDEDYYYPDLMRGMIVEAETGAGQGSYGQNLAKYTGSTTGTSRDNEICSKYTPITWQVDRDCHLISASSFDKMCADMMQQRDDMSGDTHPHGSRVLVADFLAGNNHARRNFFGKEDHADDQEELLLEDRQDSEKTFLMS